MSKVRSRLPPSFCTTVGTYANVFGSLRESDRAGGGAPRRLMLLAPSDFFTALRKDLKQRLPAPLRGFRTTRGRGRLMKVHFGEPAFHYEAWHHAGAGRLELGLHFEASAGEN